MIDDEFEDLYEFVDKGKEQHKKEHPEMYHDDHLKVFCGPDCFGGSDF